MILFRFLFTLLLLGSGATGFAAPLCSTLFSHDADLDIFADLGHAGALDFSMVMDKKARFGTKWTPAWVPSVDAPAELPLSAIHFMQNSVSQNYSDNIHTVTGNARDLRDGLLDVNQLPAIRVWQDSQGKIWTLDHRRVAAMILSGKVSKTKVVWARASDVRKDSFKMSNTDGGDSLVLTIGPQQALWVQRPEQRPRNFVFDREAVFTLLRTMKRAVNPVAFAEKMAGLSFKSLLPAANWPVPKKITRNSQARQTLPTEPPPVTTEVRIQDLLFSKTFIQNEKVPGTQDDISSAARKIQTGQITVSRLPPLRLWMDAYGRVWTQDNALLAALRLAGYEGALRAEWLSRQDYENQALFVDSQTAGQSLLLELPEHQLGVVIH